MGRKKARPIRSGGLLLEENVISSQLSSGDGELQKVDECKNEGVSDSGETLYVYVDGTNWDSVDHFDIGEVVLNDVKFSDSECGYKSLESCFTRSNFRIRFHLKDVKEGSFRLGHWPILSATTSIFLEYVVLRECVSEDDESYTVLFSGVLDGADESVSGIVHLVSLKFISLRPVLSFDDSVEIQSFKLRVEILRSAFDSCESLLETVRKPWKKSMMHVMTWLRPEVTTSEAIWGTDCDLQLLETVSHGQNKAAQFDPAAFYEAIKPSREEPMLDEDLPHLLPHLRPYQRRAAFWMVQREKGATKASGDNANNQLSVPYSVAVVSLDQCSKMFYNPFIGNISLLPGPSFLYVSGGILADEMGLGKTVELLACIFTHRRPSLEHGFASMDDTDNIQHRIKRKKVERVECVCGAASESSKYTGLWVQCDVCDAWQHGDCVGYDAKKKVLTPEVNDKVGSAKNSSSTSRNNISKRGKRDIIETDGNFICSFCSELIEAAQIETYTGATLIVCPAPILAQWYSEITRHTRPDSLKTYVYEGARNMDSSTHLRTNMNKLVTADIVLTTYDVLKEDLSHDFDRHDGDRRFLRFQKRYPVVPTLLTRINWWRLCLDEAQMVECNQASVTEMAMRLHAQHRWCVTGTPIQRKFDDMYGLLRFLRASPFDVYKWWSEIIRDPYERRDTIAMTFVHNFFKNMMWRSSKVNVADELQLPPQDQCLSWLTFSSIEEHFYQKQHETCVSFAHDVVRKLKEDLRKRGTASDFNTSFHGFLSQNEVAKLLGPLLKLRQACCHPQVGSSGLCSLHENPLTMEEILEVLISKTKIEGEEALRKIVSALNGLAAIAVIEEDENRAIVQYKEALALADENSDDFRLDPLLNLHIHYNLAELVDATDEFSQPCLAMKAQALEAKKRKDTDICKFGKFYVKRAKTDKEMKKTTENTSLEQHHDLLNGLCSNLSPNIDGKKSTEAMGPCNSSVIDNSKEERKCNIPSQISSRCFAPICLRKTSEEIKSKYLSAFSSKVTLAQQEFRTSSMEVSSIYKELETQSTVWWLDALNAIDQNKESSDELIRKIDLSVSRTTHSAGSTKASTRFKSITTLIYTIKTGLDSLQNSRQALIDRIVEIDRTMENPKDEDVLRLRYCPNCYDGDGPLCIHCELDKLFQVYEARLSLVRNANSGSMIQSVEEALNLQKQNNELNQFFRNKRTSIEHESEDNRFKERHAKESIQILKFPSKLETTLKVIKTCSKMLLGKQGTESSRKHLLLFEAMRKEYSHARSLSKAQAHLLRAHDEIKMATTRLRLKETEDEPIAINVLSREELVPSSLQLSSEKFISLSSLQRSKGQLRYLKGMAVLNQKARLQQDSLSKPQDIAKVSNSSLPVDANNYCKDDESCPICHENFPNQKMVFECGHVVCCKCCLEMTERAITHSGKGQKKWIMCPTCRQRTEFENIAYVNEQNNLDLQTLHSKDASEDCITVQGSYGTKIEAITRRILWMTLNDQNAKVLVFSSWNDVLDLLGHALAANNIAYVRMKGGRKAQIAIAQFKGQESIQGVDKAKNPVARSKPAQVLMMLIQHGANGLNLLEAQHVILIEPLLNPAAEAQAISRVHRVGQDKKTFIHRFMVRNTIEESIYKLNMGRNVTSLINARVTKSQDQPALTIDDVEALFSLTRPSELVVNTSDHSDSLRNLPPAVAAGLAAQRRLMEGQDN